MSSEIWQRPRDSRFPAKYYKFLARGRDGSELVEFTVGDIPESRYDEACRFMVKHFVPYEPKLVARGGQHDPLVLEDYFDMYMSGIKQKVSIACHQKGCDEFIGVNILEVLGRDDPSMAFHVSRRLRSRGRKHSRLLFSRNPKLAATLSGQLITFLINRISSTATKLTTTCQALVWPSTRTSLGGVGD